MRTFIVLCAALVASNLAWAIAYYRDEPAIVVDHVQGLRMDVEHGGLLHVRLGQSSTPGGPIVANPQPAGEIVLAPRAAIQLHAQLGRMIRTVQDAAASQKRTPPPDQPSL